MSKKSLIITYILAIVCAILLSTLEYPTPYHLPIGIVFLFVYPIIIIQIEKRKTHNKKIEFAEKNIEFIQNFGLPLFYIFFIAMFSFINIGYYSGKACINETYAIAVVKTSEKAGQIQTLLTKPDRSTGRYIEVNENDEEIGYTITINKNEVNRKQYFETISELVNSDIMDNSIIVPIDVKITKNPQKMISRVEYALENNIMCINGVTYAFVWAHLDTNKQKVNSVEIDYKTEENVNHKKIKDNIIRLALSVFQEVPKEVISINSKTLEKEARNAYKNKDYKKALKLLKLNAPYYSDADIDIKALEKFIEINNKIKIYPNNYKLYIERGDLKNVRLMSMFRRYSVFLSDIEGAIADYNKALELNPKAYEVYEKRGDAWAIINHNPDETSTRELRYPEDDKHVIDDYTKAIELTGGNDRLYEKLGDRFTEPQIKLSYYKQIKNPFNEYEGKIIPPIKKDRFDFFFEHSTHGYVPFKLANCYAKLGEYDNTLEILDKVIEHKEYVQEAYNLKFLYNWKAGHYKTALKNANNCSVWICKLAGIFF